MPGTTCKEAIKRWQEKNSDIPPEEAKEVVLSFQWPPIEKMDNSLGVFSECEKLVLCTNMIDRITGIGTLKNLKVLSIGRNYIKSLSGLEPLGDNLEELWISYNSIDKLKGIGVLKKLRVLLMAYNHIRDWNEVNRLNEITNLADLLLLGNPIYEGMEESTLRAEISKRLPNLKKLDGEQIIRML